MNPFLTEIENDINGLAALHDWLGQTAEPVHQMVAEFRSQRCVEGNNGKPCPMNKGQGWLETAKGKVADWIRAELRLKRHMSLRVGAERRLHVCTACSCYLPLKVWMPKSHLRDHTTAEIIAKTPSYCWLRAELLDTLAP